MSVQGKSDKKPVTLVKWRDDKFPEFCPVRTLLMYLKAANIIEGYLFPASFSSEGRQKVIPYSTFLSRFKQLCVRIVCSSPPLDAAGASSGAGSLQRTGPFGCHCLRKTAYLFATWSGASDMDMMMSARHKSYANAVKYKKDADAIMHMAAAAGDDLATVAPTCKSVYLENLQLARSVNRTLEGFDLHALADVYIRNLKVGNPPKSVLDYVQCISTPTKDDMSLDQELQKLLQGLPSETAERIRFILVRIQMDIINSVTTNDALSEETNPSSCDPPSNDTLICTEDVSETPHNSLSPITSPSVAAVTVSSPSGIDPSRSPAHFPPQSQAHASVISIPIIPSTLPAVTTNRNSLRTIAISGVRRSMPCSSRGRSPDNEKSLKQRGGDNNFDCRNKLNDKKLSVEEKIRLLA